MVFCKVFYSMAELRQYDWRAYNALPSTYRNDSCLGFFVTEDNRLFCGPKPDQVEVLGDWESEFVNGRWVETFRRTGTRRIYW